MPPAELTQLLDDPRPVVREKAIQQLAKVGNAAVPALIEVLTGARPERLAGLDVVEARNNAVWALTRIDGAPARDAIRSVLSDRGEIVRRSAIYAAGLWRDGAAVPPLLTARGVDHPARSSARRRRGAGTDWRCACRAGARRGLGVRAGSGARTLADLRAHRDRRCRVDRQRGSEGRAPRSRRATLIALDQIGGGQLNPEGMSPYSIRRIRSSKTPPGGSRFATRSGAQLLPGFSRRACRLPIGRRRTRRPVAEAREICG